MLTKDCARQACLGDCCFHRVGSTFLPLTTCQNVGEEETQSLLRGSGRVFEAGCAPNRLLECESRKGLGCLRAVVEIGPPMSSWGEVGEGGEEGRGWALSGLAREPLPCRLAAAVGKAAGESWCRGSDFQGSGDSQPEFRPMEMSGWAAGSLSPPGASSSSRALFGSFHLAGVFKASFS